jgi:hypothetical protein
VRLPKVATEMALHVLAYNLTRVMNIIVRLEDRVPANHLLCKIDRFLNLSDVEVAPLWTGLRSIRDNPPPNKQSAKLLNPVSTKSGEGQM